ncbi:initiation factor 2 [Microthyrium microscopicum]|uniref:Translation initiation factor IF-2, mitochondrial n=1 Tax=Microthyrium microscopicum TaxID=703497 RepID=A0A6A6U7X6_9PEZI|nr:initiation factor 2 [Microthyrium microscopicum]
MQAAHPHKVCWLCKHSLRLRPNSSVLRAHTQPQSRTLQQRTYSSQSSPARSYSPHETQGIYDKPPEANEGFRIRKTATDAPPKHIHESGTPVSRVCSRCGSRWHTDIECTRPPGPRRGGASSDMGSILQSQERLSQQVLPVARTWNDRGNLSGKVRGSFREAARESWRTSQHSQGGERRDWAPPRQQSQAGGQRDWAGGDHRVQRGFRNQEQQKLTWNDDRLRSSGKRPPPEPVAFSGWMPKEKVDEFREQEMLSVAAKSDLSSKMDDIRSRKKSSPGKRDRRLARDEDEERLEKPKARRGRQKEDEEDDGRSFRRSKEDYQKEKEERKRLRLEAEQKAAHQKQQLKIPHYISNSNLAKLLDTRWTQFVDKMEQLGFKELSHDNILTAEDASLIAMEFGYEPQVISAAETLIAAPWPKELTDLPIRPPVVTIMGHVDHGKTTILDYLRNSSVAASEHGGITQHIGAFSVPLSSGKTITFLDTPGHAAFLSMRQRGATVTDIVVLVVAADDGVMPQTIEAIKHAKAADVPVIVAINKIDKGEANATRVKTDLAAHDIALEDFGGDVPAVAVSGKTGQGMSSLEETIITLSEILDHRAPSSGPVEGWILEASTKPHGRVATLLVRRGTLTVGTIVVAGTAWARVKTIHNEAGTLLDSAGPGTAVEVDGWRTLPQPGDEALAANDEQHAAVVVRAREAVDDTAKLARDTMAINAARRAQRETFLAAQAAKKERYVYSEEAFRSKTVQGAFRETADADGIARAHFVVKGDVGGSVEAVVGLVSGLGNNQVRPHIVRASAGAVNEGDIELAAAAGGRILVFGMSVDAEMRGQAARMGVELVETRVIYRVAEAVNAILEGLLPAVTKTRVTGEAVVQAVFNYNLKGSKMLKVAGCRVRNGLVAKGSKVRVIRGVETVYEGGINSLKNVKKEVTEMKKDTECGMSFENWEGFETGDKIQCYSEWTEQVKLETVTQ